jgi:hypothetical protein
MNDKIKRRGAGSLATCWACLSNKAAITLYCVPVNQAGHDIKIKKSAWLDVIILETRTLKCNQQWHVVSTDIVNTNLLSTKITFAYPIALILPFTYSTITNNLKILLHFLELIMWHLDLRQKPVTCECNLFYGCNTTRRLIRWNGGYSELKACFDSPPTFFYTQHEVSVSSYLAKNLLYFPCFGLL